MLQFLIIFDEGKTLSYVEKTDFFHSHDVRNIVLERRKARPSYFPLVRNQLDPFVSLEREFRVEKSDTRADYVYVERISNGQTDPIRRQVGLPKFSIMERFTSLNFSTFPRFPPPFFFFLFKHIHSLRYRETCSPKLARFANRYSESRTCDFEHAKHFNFA